MILNWILQQIHSFLLFIIGPLTSAPDASLPSAVSSAVTSIGGFLAGLAQTFPTMISTALGMFVATLVIENWHFIYKGIMWVIKKIPGID